MVRVKSLKYVHDFVVEFTFTDDSVREIDLESFLHGPIFQPLRNDIELFKKFRVHRTFRTIVWPNGASLDPDVLYLGLTPAAWEVHAGRS